MFKLVSGEILYKYLGPGKKSIDETDVQLFDKDASEFIFFFKIAEIDLQNAVTKRINKDRTNLETLFDLFETGQTMILRLKASNIPNKINNINKIVKLVEKLDLMIHGKR